MKTPRGFVSLGIVLVIIIGLALLGGAGWYVAKKHVIINGGNTTIQVPVSQPPATIGYGSRAGMEVTVVSEEGLDTSHAVVRTEHTRENAIAFCEGYVGEHPATEECIQGELAVRLKSEITANCTTGEFTDFFGNSHQFLGLNPDTSTDFSVAKYAIKDFASGEIESDSGASGYITHMFIFKALCPKKAPSGDSFESNSAPQPSATIDQSSLAASSATPTITGTLSNLDGSLAVAVVKTSITLPPNKLPADAAVWQDAADHGGSVVIGRNNTTYSDKITVPLQNGTYTVGIYTYKSIYTNAVYQGITTPVLLTTGTLIITLQ